MQEIIQDKPWIDEERAPTTDEWQDWCRSQKGCCPEYTPMFPLNHWQGKCSNYIHNSGKPCGVPFVAKAVCLTGIKQDGATRSPSSKSFRKNFDKWKRSEMGVAYRRAHLT